MNLARQLSFSNAKAKMHYKTSTKCTSNANAAGNKGKTANVQNHTALFRYKPDGTARARVVK